MKVFCSSDFPFLYIHKHFLKNLWKQKHFILFKWFLSNFKVFCCSEFLSWYYQKNKEKLQKEPWERYQNLSEEQKGKRRKKSKDRCKNLFEEEKEKKRQYHPDWNENLSEEEKQKKVEYMRNYYLAHKK